MKTSNFSHNHHKIIKYSFRAWLNRNSVRYNLLFTATHSFKSSPSGSITASLRFPLPKVAAACFIKSYWWVPSGIFFFGLNVLEERAPLQSKVHNKFLSKKLISKKFLPLMLINDYYIKNKYHFIMSQ